MSFRIAVVGLGNAGYTLHLPALQGIPDVTVVGGVDPDRARRKRAAERFRTEVFATFDEMVAAAAPNVIIIGTPPDTHAEYCLRSFAAGADVICEKPFASSVREANDVIAASSRMGRRIALNHEFREMPIFRALRTEVQRSKEDIVFAHVWQLMDLPPWAEPGWRGQMLQRTLYEAGVHLVDYLIALFGEKPIAVSGTTSTCGVRESDTDAVALATLEFSRGRLAQIIQNRLCKARHSISSSAQTAVRVPRASFAGVLPNGGIDQSSVTPATH